MNLAANLNRRLFSVTERAACNVKGKLRKGKLVADKIKIIKEITFRMFPLENKETMDAAWKTCVTAIDEVNRRLNKTKKPTE